MDNRIARVASCEEHLQAWSFLARLLRQLPAIHPWQHNVRKEKANLGVQIQCTKSVDAITSLNHAVPEVKEHLYRQLTHLVIVLDESIRNLAIHQFLTGRG